MHRDFFHDLAEPKFDRSYAYDHAGRITEALSGAEARHEGFTTLRPYNETFVYDALDHLVERPVNNVWSGGGGTFSPSHQTYENNRNTGWQYDAAGNLTDSVNVQYTIDAAGQANRVVSLSMLPFNPNTTIWGITNDLSRSLDGDGAVVSQVDTETTHGSAEGDVTTTATTYFVRSTVLSGKVVTEINSETGQRGLVYLGNEVLAWQLTVGTTQSVKWEHRDPGNASLRLTKSTGLSDSTEKAELDPLGTNAGTSDPTTPPSLKRLSLYPGFGDAGLSADTQCNVNGILQPCTKQILAAVDRGALEIQSIAGSASTWEAIRVDDPTDTSDTPEDPDNPKNPVTINERYHYELVYTGVVTTSVQQRQPQIPVPFDTSGIRSGLEDALKNQECRDFVTWLLNAAQSKKNPIAKGGDIMALFESVVSDKGGFTRTAPPGSAGYGNPTGRIAKNDASVFLFGSARHSASMQLHFDIEGALHELLHLAGSNKYYTDKQFADLVHDNPAYKSHSPYPPDTPALRGELKDPGAIGWGAYWNDVLKQKCFNGN